MSAIRSSVIPHSRAAQHWVVHKSSTSAEIAITIEVTSSGSVQSNPSMMKHKRKKVI